MKKLLLIAVLLIVLVACAPPEPTDVADTTNLVEIVTFSYGGYGRRIVRIEDTDYGIVCYVMNGYSEGGISCLPMEPR